MQRVDGGGSPAKTMNFLARARTQRILITIALTVLGLGLGALLTAWSGVYNIAASRGHWAITEWFLEFGMRNSVKSRADGIEAPQLDRPDLYVLGAGHFHSGCAPCHGAPGLRPGLPAQHALPPAPDLTHLKQEWSDGELFWIVKHGIKYTAMPAWASQDRDDEVWAVVAFLKRLQRLDAQGYRELALGAAEPPPPSGQDIALVGSWRDAVGACSRCHGAEGRRPPSNLVPVLHGQPAEFLAAALQSYSKGIRPSGIMQPVASELTSAAIEKLARYYSGLSVPAPRAAKPDASRGGALVNDGDPAARIPACLPCHGETALRTFPRLAGQNAAYMANRLRRWKDGERSHTGTDSIMAPIARLLSNQQIDEAAAYLAGLSHTPQGEAKAR
jgi:cytochrome c553